MAVFNIEKDAIEDEFILKQPGGYVPKSVFDEEYIESITTQVVGCL